MNDDKQTTENDEPEATSFDEAGELRKLVRSIQLAERYFLFFASCNQIPHQTKLIKQIKKELPAYKIQLIDFDKPVENLLSELRRRLKNKKNDAIFVTGLKNSIPGDKRAKQNNFLANLNVTRDAFPQFLACPLILWLPEYAVGKIINGAPDFFSVRSGVFFFENDEKLMSKQISQAISIGYDEHDALFLEERRQRIENLKELLADYQSLLAEKRDLQIEYQLKDKLVNIYYITANYTEAEKLITELIVDAKSKNDSEVINQLNNLALVYKSQGRYDEAVEKLEEALRIDEQTIGKEHPNYAIRLSNLAVVYQSQGRYDEAIEKYEEALRIGEQTIGKEHPEYATYLNNLAVVYQSQGKYDDAIKKYEEALRIGEQTIGKEHPNYAIRLNNLAVVYQSQGRYDEAIEKFQEALRIDEKTVGKEHPNYATRLNNLANVYVNQGKFPDALNLHREALRIFSSTLPENHPYIKSLEDSVERCEEIIKSQKKD